MYITPTTRVHSRFEEVKEFLEKYGGLYWFDGEKNEIDIGALAQGRRTLIVGEPGVGKTLLIKKLKEHFDTKSFVACLVELRQEDAIKQIDIFLKKKEKSSKVLLLDALDEVKSSLFPSILQKIEEISKKHPNLQLYISGRWIFVSKYGTSFPEFRFITISPFSSAQVRDYLIATGRSESDVEVIFNRIMPFSHNRLVIQIPRYLFYLSQFLKEKGINAISAISRNELFE